MIPATRGRRGRAYTLLTPENHFVSRRPDLPGAAVVKLVSPRLAPARFAQSLVRFGGPVSVVLTPGQEHFLFGLDGSAVAGAAALGPGGFAYVAAGDAVTLTAGDGDRLIWLTRVYEPWPGVTPPASCHGHRDEVAATPTPTPGLDRTELLAPTDPAFDFNMTLMTFAPGVGLPQIEIHDEEHGLYMTAGGGTYALDGDEHPVEADDFIYMAPYCPQGFAAGPDGGEYLLYKDVWRA